MLAVIVKGKQIIIAVVDNQLVGADDILCTLAPFRLLLQIVNGVFQILEADFFGNMLFSLDHFAHGVVDRGDIAERGSVQRPLTGSDKGIGADFS